MGTSFPCDILFTAQPGTGRIILGIGPLDMGNVAEMLDYLGTEEFRTAALEAAAQALTSENDFVPVEKVRTPSPNMVVHLRGRTRTACGLELWTVNGQGKRVATVGSVSYNFASQVTCDDCRRVWIETHG